ncbi:nuclease-related domain-containing protein [Halobacillus seohaensis]|uniref:Nuclease-related domain-containing protein n=1 Tax=Halobacillus seohaensis TaxID=447421 RepID=A0ABW2EN34_9BACI
MTPEHIQLEVLHTRMLQDHFKRSDIQTQLLKQSAGHFGETTTDHFLQYITQENYHVMLDLQLFDGISYFQIDALVVTREFLLILEVKNFKGELTFDFDHNQLFRKIDDHQDIFPDPFLQVEHQSLQLTRWLGRYDFPEVPIHSFVVITNPKTVIKTQGSDLNDRKNRIVRAKRIIPAIYEFAFSTNHREFFKEDEMSELVSRLKTENTPYQKLVMEKYALSMNDLIMGVQCENCSRFRMDRRREHWLCPHCGMKSKNAHLRTLKDYQVLFGNEITNAEFRRFACLRSRKVAWRLLSDTFPLKSGSTKDCKYIINWDREQ